MKIVVKTNDLKHNIKINLPMCIITTVLRFVNISSFTNHTDDISEHKIVNDLFKNCQKDSLIKGLKYLRKNHKGLVLVEVDSPNGDFVKIQI